MDKKSKKVTGRYCPQSEMRGTFDGIALAAQVDLIECTPRVIAVAALAAAPRALWLWSHHPELAARSAVHERRFIQSSGR